MFEQTWHPNCSKNGHNITSKVSGLMLKFILRNGFLSGLHYVQLFLI